MTIHLERLAGTTYCPECGELHRHTVRSVHDGGYPKTVECRGCGHVWEWPSRAEFARRERARNARYAEQYRSDPEFAESERQRKREYYRDNAERIRSERRQRYERMTVECAWCGTEFHPSGKGVYCCDSCRRAARRAYGGLVDTIASVRLTMRRMEGST